MNPARTLGLYLIAQSLLFYFFSPANTNPPTSSVLSAITLFSSIVFVTVSFFSGSSQYQMVLFISAIIPLAVGILLYGMGKGRR